VGKLGYVLMTCKTGINVGCFFCVFGSHVCVLCLCCVGGLCLGVLLLVGSGELKRAVADRLWVWCGADQVLAGGWNY